MSYTDHFYDKSAVAYVSNEDNGKTLVAEPASTEPDRDFYLWLESVSYAVSEPSVADGVCEIIDQDGTVRWRINTDGIKEDTVIIGREGRGIRIGQNGYLNASVSGSSGNQASVSISVKARSTRRKEDYGA